ncbi:MAG: glycosyltransferase family 2 protein [Pseudohongiellaceae bacterium]
MHLELRIVMTIEEIIFWAAAILLAYTYAGYPLFIWGRAALGRRPVARADILPAVSVLVIVHNEENCIEDRIQNLLDLDYPRERLEIVIASDASTDNTVPLAQRFQNATVKVIPFSAHRGKPSVLNQLVPVLEGEIAVLMDVRQRVERSALRALVSNFCDPRVGAVSGELILEDGPDSSEVGSGLGAYWRYEKFIRHNESRVDSSVGATGAFYGLRRRLFTSIPSDTLIDDMLIPMLIVKKGYRVLFEPDARAFDRVSATAEAEFVRKVRTIAGNFQLLFRHRWLLNPVSNRLWLQTISHKFFRLLGPLCLGAVFVSNLLLLDQPFYDVTMALQILFYAASMAGRRIRHSQHGSKLVNVPYAFCLLNWATVMGFSRFIRGQQQITWQKAKT